MPNTLAHIGLQVLGQRALGIGPKDFGLVLCGCVIPDLPWILRRVISVFEYLDPLRLFAYSSIQSSLFISLILAAAVSLLLRESVRAILVIGISCFFHLLLDALQIKWSNGVILLAPFDWATVNWGKVWPDNPVVYVASLLGAAVILYALSTSRDFSVQFGATRIQRNMASIMIIVWLALPVAFIPTAFGLNNHYLITVTEVKARSEKYLELDRSTVQVRGKKFYAELLSGEQIELLPSNIPGPGVYSIAGKFDGPQRLFVIAWHRHSAFRDVASLIGLCAILFGFVLSTIRQLKNN